VTHESVAEGWYEDPFEIHEYRWFSAGRPTALVKDGRAEGTDPPPDTEVTGPLVPESFDVDSGANGSDLRRADEAEVEDREAITPSEAVWNVAPEVFPLQ
jgi:hypothetical protein